ncbi:hypothetical protein L1049_016615 [Liquidambar formosana]|uniref:Uncharacterized protein n=1 Tax=Liquidambar formosana TaxID=63359 RepID=A0AAP0S5J8_LIQFO
MDQQPWWRHNSNDIADEGEQIEQPMVAFRNGGLDVKRDTRLQRPNLDGGDRGGDGVVEEEEGGGEGEEDIGGKGRREVDSERRRKRKRTPKDWREVKRWTGVLPLLCAISGHF